MTGDIQMNSSTPYLQTEVFEKLISLGCCKICSSRYCGETNATTYKLFYESFELLHKVVDPKRVACNPCTACLGMLQPYRASAITDKIIEKINEREYDNPTFNIALTIPVSFYIRAHALLLFILQNYKEHAKERLPNNIVTITLKDAWKYIFADKIGKQTNKTFDPDSNLRIEVEIYYEDDNVELKPVIVMSNAKVTPMQRRQGIQKPTISRKAVESLLEVVDPKRFIRFCKVPPTIPTTPAICKNVYMEQNCIYFGGRYNKYVRDLPQTAWMVQDQRKLDTSVHEIIGDCAQEITKAATSKLIASGREDVDVRMLGSGRPFALELSNARKILLSHADVRELEAKINKLGAGKVSVNSLKLVSRTRLDELKMGEEKKSKTYEAYCIAWNVDEERLQAVSELMPVVLQQKTPVRVLHRRNIATRPRTIHWVKISNIRTEGDKVFFKIVLNTQAGTYIKEFIHGDFGRTKPSLGDLLGGVSADCLALDVLSIDLGWPP